MKPPVYSIGLLPLVFASFLATSARAQGDLQASVNGNQVKSLLPDENRTKDLTGESEIVMPLVSSGAQHLVPGALPVARPGPSLPRVFAPTRPRNTYTRFPWKRNIVTTLFWVGETPTANNPVPNTVSAWDHHWTSNYGGYDTPKISGRKGYRPKNFTPKQNPFYFALPYNDIKRNGTKASARAVVPWFKKSFYRSGKTVLKGRWMAIRRGDKICYAQWEDVGPFETDDHDYVFGDKRPKTTGNGGAGLDVSPAVKDYLNFSTRAVVDWRFVDVDEVPDGPWKKWGNNNPFANAASGLSKTDSNHFSESIVKVRELRDRLIVSANKTTSSPTTAATADEKTAATPSPTVDTKEGDASPE